MKKSDNTVFQLIKTMNAHEKGYFKMDCSPKQALLFDAIDKQVVYDETKIKSQFQSDKYIGKNLSMAKMNLQTTLLKSLRNYSSSSTIDFILLNLKADIEILLSKGLSHLCRKHIARMKLLAIKHERWIPALDAIQYERNCVGGNIPAGITYQDLIRLEREEKNIIRIIKNLNEYNSILSQITTYIRTRGTRIKNISAINALLNRSILKNEKHALSKTAKMYYHHIKSAYYIDIEPEPKLAYRHSQAYLMLQKEIAEETFYSVMEYINALYFYAQGAKQVKEYRASLAGIHEIKKIMEQKQIPFTQEVATRIFFMVYGLESDIYNIIGEFENTIALISEIEKGLEEYENHIKRYYREVLYYNIMRGYVGAGKYSDAIKWLNRLINERDNESNEYLQSITRIINLIVHFELRNYELLESLLKSTYRFLSKRKRLYRLEKTIISFIRGQIYSPYTGRQLTNGYKAMYAELKSIFKNQFEKNILEYFDFISWVESKIENRSMAEIIREKTQQLS